MAKSTKSHDRAPNETTITFNLPISLKASLVDRTARANLKSLAYLIRLGLEFHEKRDWKDVPQVYYALNAE